MKISIRKRYDYGKKVALSFEGVNSKTVQSDRKEADINYIVAKAKKTGVIPVTNRKAIYGDFCHIHDFHALQIKLAEAREDFDGLPANIRKRFENDPAVLSEWLADPANNKEAIELGLIIRPKIASGALPDAPTAKGKVAPLPEADLGKEGQKK